MQFQCQVVNPPSGSAVLFYMVNSHQRAILCLKVARQLNTRSFLLIGFSWFSLFTEVGRATQEWLEYFSLMVVLVHLHENCASCMVNTISNYLHYNWCIPHISIAVCHVCLPFICCCKP